MRSYLNLNLLVWTLFWGVHCSYAEPIQEFEETVVTASHIEESADLASVRVHIISQQNMQEWGVRNVQEALQLLPSFRLSVHPATPDFSQGSLQGLPGMYVKVLMDGVEVVGDLGGAIPLNLIPVLDIERIEVLEGAASVLYGSDAMGGVINLITKAGAKKSWNGKWSMSVSDRLEQQYEVAYRKQKDLSVDSVAQKSRMRAGADASWGYDPGMQKEVQNIFGNTVELYPLPKQNTQAGRAFVEWKKARKALGIQGSIRRTERTLRDATLFENHYDDMGWTVTLHGRTNFGKRSEIETQVNQQGFEHAQKQSNLQFASEFPLKSTELYTTQIHTRWLYRYNDVHRWLVGFMGSLDYLTGVDFPDGQTEHQSEIFVQDLIEWGSQKQWLLSPGFRWSGVLTPKLSLRHSIDSNWLWRLSYGMGYREPTIKEKYWEFYHQAPFNFLLKGNPKLEPEISHSFNGSVEFQKQQLQITAAAYANFLSNLIADVVVDSAAGIGVDSEGKSMPYIHVRSYENVNKAKTLGASADLNYTLQMWQWQLGYSRLWTEDLLFQSAHQFRGTSLYNWAWRKASAGVSVQWNSPQLQSLKPYRESPDYWMVDIHGQLATSKRGMLLLRVNNVLDNWNQGQENYYGLHGGRTWSAQVRYEY